MSLEITDVNPKNVDALGFFCAMSKPDSEGYQSKLRWTKNRFREGLKLKLITRGGRGFIEYIPGKWAWRGIRANKYMVIHCMWVVGRSKRHGCGKALLAQCIRDAKSQGLAGVAAVTARNQLGLPPTSYFLKQGFEVVDTAPPDLELVVLKFGKAESPSFLNSWERKLKRFGPGLSLVCSPQCPYNDSYVAKIAATTKRIGMTMQVLRLETLGQVRKEAPSAYGSAAMVVNRKVVTHLYHSMSERRLKTLTQVASTS